MASPDFCVILQTNVLDHWFPRSAVYGVAFSALFALHLLFTAVLIAKRELTELQSSRVDFLIVNIHDGVLELRIS